MTKRRWILGAAAALALTTAACGGHRGAACKDGDAAKARAQASAPATGG